MLLLCTFAQLIFLCYGLVQTGAYDYFFGEIESDIFLRDVAFPLGIANIFEYVLTVLWDIFLLYISFLGAFLNKIKVRQDDIWIFFPPRLFYRIYKTNIHSIQEIDYNSLSKVDRLINWNFSKDPLYKVICYDTEFVICSKDSGGMQKLMSDINPRNNPCECDEEDFNPNKFTKAEKIIIGIFIVVIFSVIQNIFDFF